MLSAPKIDCCFLTLHWLSVVSAQEVKPIVAPVAPPPVAAPPPPEPKIVIHSEQDFFDKVKKALKSQEVYDNFLRWVSDFVSFSQESH